MALKKVKIFSIILLFLPCLGITGQVSDHSLTLEDLVRIGFENSLDLKNDKNNLVIGELGLKNKFSKFLPSLDLNAKLGPQKTSGMNRDDLWSSHLQLTLSENIYNNGTDFIEWNKAKKTKQKLNIELERKKAKLCLDIAVLYYNYSQSVKKLEIEKFQHQLLKKQLASIEYKFKHGLEKRIEYLRFKAKMKKSDLLLKEAEEEGNSIIESLKKLIVWKNKEGESTELKIALMKMKPLNVKSLVFNRPDLSSHYLFKQAKIKKDINEYDVELVKKNNWPKITLESSVNYSKNDYLKGLDSSTQNNPVNWGVMLNFDFNLWDWGMRKREISIAKLEQNKMNNNIDIELLSLNKEIDTLILDLNLYKEKVSLNQELVDLEKHNYNELEKNYYDGKTTFLDLTGALDNYTSAEKSYIDSYYKLKEKMAQYLYHKGNLYENINSI